MPDKRPAILGGDPAFPAMVDIVGPVLPKLDTIAERLSVAMESGKLTNNSLHAREFEAACQEYLGVKHAIAVANGTLSLILMMKSLGSRGKAIIPSFTYIATAHALDWAGFEPVFADIDADTYNVTPRTVKAVLSKDVKAIVAVPVFGNPCDVVGLQKLADEAGVALFYDSAHAFGSTIGGTKVGGFGRAESFSLHATKALPAGEGGLITTNDTDLAAWLRAARVFGDYGDHDTRFAGTNAKMSEFPALLGLEGLKDYERMLSDRQAVAAEYYAALESLPGLKFQQLGEDCTSTYQNFSIQIDPPAFGLSRDQLYEAMNAENIMTRKYFWPPAHKHAAYQDLKVNDVDLPNTMRVSSEILCLPMHPGKPLALTRRIGETVCELWRHRHEVRNHI